MFAARKVFLCKFEQTQCRLECAVLGGKVVDAFEQGVQGVREQHKSPDALLMFMKRSRLALNCCMRMKSITSVWTCFGGLPQLLQAFLLCCGWHIQRIGE